MGLESIWKLKKKFKANNKWKKVETMFSFTLNKIVF